MASHSSILAGESHGQRSLAGYSPWGRKESGTTKAGLSTQVLSAGKADPADNQSGDLFSLG